MRRATPDAIYSYTAASNPVTFTVQPGEAFQVETLPTCGREFDSHAGRFVPNAPSAINGTTGCIAVAGAQAGQNVIVHVLGIAPDEFGYTSVNRHSILLPHLSAEDGWLASRKIVRIVRRRPRSGRPVAASRAGRSAAKSARRPNSLTTDQWKLATDLFIEWSPTLKIPAAPMIGYLGVARPNEVLSNAHNGQFGGNFDVQEIAAGCRVQLPVLVDGALLHVGDVHAIQGDGEIDGAGGIETGAVLTLKVELVDRPKRFRNPRIETDEFIATTGFARPAEAAFALALEDLICWMVDDFGFAVTEAHMLLAQVLSARATQFVNPLISYICKIARKYLVG